MITIGLHCVRLSTSCECVKKNPMMSAVSNQVLLLLLSLEREGCATWKLQLSAISARPGFRQHSLNRCSCKNSLHLPKGCHPPGHVRETKTSSVLKTWPVESAAESPNLTHLSQMHILGCSICESPAGVPLDTLTTAMLFLYLGLLVNPHFLYIDNNIVLG